MDEIIWLTIGFLLGIMYVMIVDMNTILRSEDE